MKKNISLGEAQPKKLRFVYFLKSGQNQVDGGYFLKNKFIIQCVVVHHKLHACAPHNL